MGTKPHGRNTMYRTTVFSVKISKKGGITLENPTPPKLDGEWILLNCMEGPTVEEWTKNYVAVWEKVDE
jgi:hypothetical protein